MHPGLLLGTLAPYLAAGGFLDPKELLDHGKWVGLAVLFLIVFAESGLLIGFFLPGDSLLFTAGLFAAGVYPDVEFNILVVVIGCFAAAVIGDSVGYAFGKKVGPTLFRRPNSRFFKQENVEKARAFFEKHGAKAIVMARFVPIVRTFAPILAGVGEMPYRTFVTFNVMGGCLWAMGVTLLGYTLGENFPWIEDYLLPVIGVIILLSILPIVIEVIRARRHKAKAKVSA